MSDTKKLPKKRPWMKFFGADWRSDLALRSCSPSARAVWLDMLTIMHEAEPRGSLLVNGAPVSADLLATICGMKSREIRRILDELETAKVFSREGEIIFSRRMRRETCQAEIDRENGLLGGNPTLRLIEGGASHGMGEGLTPPIKPISQKLEARDNIHDIDVAFARFKAAYPRRDGSQDWAKARDAFGKHLKAGVDPEAIIGGAQRYAADCRRREVEGTPFTKQARTWLNGRSWEEYSGDAPQAPAQAPIAWGLLIAAFKRTGNWPGRLGPAPGFSGCKAPPELLSEAGFGPGGEPGGAPPSSANGAAHG